MLSIRAERVDEKFQKDCNHALTLIESKSREFTDKFTLFGVKLKVVEEEKKKFKSFSEIQLAREFAAVKSCTKMSPKVNISVSLGNGCQNF